MTTSGYQLRRLAPPPVEPVTVADLRKWLNLDDDIDDDDLLADLIATAREYAENYTKRCFVESSYELAIDDFPATTIRVPIAPLLAVVSVKYRGTDDAYLTVDPSDYTEALDDEPPRVEFFSWWGWPTAAFGCQRPRSVVLELRAGYPPAGSPADAANVPATIKTAIKLAAAHWYENREAVTTAARMIPTELPLGVQALLDPYRRLF